MTRLNLLEKTHYKLKKFSTYGDVLVLAAVFDYLSASLNLQVFSSDLSVPLENESLLVRDRT